MPDQGWIAPELVLPEEGQEVLTFTRANWGLRKGYHIGGEWFDASHRPIHVDYWKPGPEDAAESPSQGEKA